MSHAFFKVCRLAASLMGRSAAISAIAILSFLLIASPLQAATLSHADETAYAYIISPANGQTVSEAFNVKFGLSGMGIAPAGIEKDGTGHHHLLIDIDELPSLTEPLPATAQIRHFGGGQTEATIDLAPGEHTLQLLLGNYTHIPHDNPVLSEKIKITVQ
ncbi:MAG: DUF4399 domain-containing protein [Cyanobacteria bacterium P01_C01_bin.69]